MSDLTNGLLPLLDEELSLRWIITLLHFLWQGTVVGLVAAVVVRSLRHASASMRHSIYAMALLSLPLCMAVTFVFIQVPSVLPSPTEPSPLFVAADATTAQLASIPQAASSPGALESIAASQLNPQFPVQSEVAKAANSRMPAETQVSTDEYVLRFLSPFAPWVFVAYAVCVGGFLLRLAVAMWGGQRLRASTKLLADCVLLESIRAQATRMGLRIVPVVAYCERVTVPTVIGVLRPMILLPSSIITGLSTEELAAILGHELAHIRRYDLWMNLVQRLIESLLFFHPVVWWLSRQVSKEREICCDDLVLGAGHAPMNYAGALLRMAELCVLARQTQLASLSIGGRGPAELEHRIVRLMQVKERSTLRLTRTGVMILFALLITSVATPAMLSVFADQTEVTAADEPNGAKSNEAEPGDEPGSPTIKSANATISSGPSTEQTIETEAISKIEGRVIGEIQGVAVAAHFTLDDDSQLLKNAKEIVVVKTTTDVDGKYSIEVPLAYVGKKNARVSFRLEHPGYLTRNIPFCYVDDFRDQNIGNDETYWATRQQSRSAVKQTQLRKGRQLVGQALLADGKPAAGALVATQTKYRAYSWKDLDFNDYSSSSSTTADADGRFELLTDSSATMIISLDGQAPLVIDDLWGSQVDVPETETRNQSPSTFHLPKAIRPHGRVTTFDGQPIAGAIVIAQRDFRWNEFNMPLSYSLSCAANEQGDYELPPMPAENYKLSVLGRIDNLTEINAFNRVASNLSSPLLLHAGIARADWPKAVPIDVVIADQKTTLAEANMSPVINLQAVEAVTAKLQLSFVSGPPEQSRLGDVRASGKLNEEDWFGRLHRADKDGMVRLVVPKGVRNLKIETGHALHRRSAKEPWQLGSAIHLGTLDADISGLEVKVAELAKIRVKLNNLPKAAVASGNVRINFQAFYVRDGYGENQPGLQPVSLVNQFQTGNDDYRAQAIPNEEFLLRITEGIGNDAKVLHEERLTLAPGDNRLLTIDLAK